MICPVCKYGYIHKYEIIPLEKIVFICNTCDALWLTVEQVKSKKAVYNKDNQVMRLDHFLKKFDLIQIPENLRDLGKISE